MAETSPEHLSLAAEFPPATREAWLKLVEAALKGGSPERLRSRTYDGLTIEPLYPRAARATPVAGRAPVTPWRILQRVDHPDPVTANGEALHDLENGATGLLLVGRAAPGANGFGLPEDAAAVACALDGVYLDAGGAIECDAGAAGLETAQHLAALVRARKVAPESTDIRFGLDPLGAIATGAAPADWAAPAGLLAAGVRALSDQGFKGPFVAADARAVHAAGGAEAQELAFALASGVAYLRALEAGGFALDVARRMIFFRLAVDADQFLGIAKLRALRKLWARVEDACGLTPAPAFVTAETAWRMLTRRDPWVNMLRTTMATFAAGVGGADAVSVLPFTAALGLPDRFARRIARNTQLILLDESNLAKVTDPAAGAGGIESLTDALAGTAWTLFQGIEAAGGAASALASGMLQRRIAETRAAREKAVARRKDALTGATEFPDIHELPVAVLDVTPRTAPPAANAIRDPLPRIRLAAPFERLRDASDAALKRSGGRPKVFLANLGRPAAFTPRAMFAKNFFEAGGIEAATNDGFAAEDGRTDLAALAAAFAASGARLACLCASDEVYAAEAPAAAAALTTGGAGHIYLAGRPGDREEALRAAGVATFVFVGCDALATLTAAHDILGIER